MLFSKPIDGFGRAGSLIFIVFFCFALFDVAIFPAMAQGFTESGKILLDNKVEGLGKVTYKGKEYYVVEYRNILPYASGIEIFTSAGERVSDRSLARHILSQLAWKEAASQITPSDIDTLKNILHISDSIYTAVSPVASVTNSLVNYMEELKSYCIDVKLLGRKCAWDAVKIAYPQITTFESEIRSLNRELSEWVSVSGEVRNTLPDAISELESLKYGGEISPSLQSKLTKSISAFNQLRQKTDGISSKLSRVIATLSSAEASVRKASNKPYIGSVIGRFADLISDLNLELKELRNKVSTFSNQLSEQSSKLSALIATANKKTEEYYKLWESRRDAQVKVYVTILILITLVLALAGTIVYWKRESKLRKRDKIEDEKRERRLEKSLNPRIIAGASIVIVGLVLIFYSFLTANRFFTAELINKTSFYFTLYLVTLLGFMFSLLIGVYAIIKTESIGSGFIPFLFAYLFARSLFQSHSWGFKAMLFSSLFIVTFFVGAVLIELGFAVAKRSLSQDKFQIESKIRIIGVMMVAIGLYMLVTSYINAFSMVHQSFKYSNETMMFFNILFSKTFFLIIMSAIGFYVTGKGTKLIDHFGVGSLFVIVGTIMLLHVFLVAQAVINENVEQFRVSMMISIIRLDFLMFMLFIGVYLTRKGIAELFKKEGVES